MYSRKEEIRQGKSFLSLKSLQTWCSAEAPLKTKIILLCNYRGDPSSFTSIENWVLYLKSAIQNSSYICTLAQSLKTLTYPPQFSPTCIACFGHNLLTELSLCWFSWVIHLNGPATLSAVDAQSIYCLKQGSSYIQSVAEEAIKQKRFMLELWICTCK